MQDPPTATAEQSRDAAEQPRSTRDTREVRERILDSAARVFGEQGYEGARVADVARRCGMSTGAIYSRWLTKQELFLAAVERRGAHNTLSVSTRADLSVPEKLALLGGGLLSADQDDEARNLLLEACVIARRDSSLKADIARALDVEASVLTEVIAHGKASGEIDETLSTEAIVLACQSLSLGVRLAAAAEPRSGGQPTSEEWNQLLARFIGSIAPPASSER